MVWRELVADRRSEGARLNGPPHDHFGFLLMLPEAGQGGRHRVEVREQRTGVVFGRLMQGGEDPGLAETSARIGALRDEAARLSEDLAQIVPPVPAARALAALGAALGAAPEAPLVLAACARPVASGFVLGCADAAEAGSALARIVPEAGLLGWELALVVDFDPPGLEDLLARLRGVTVLHDVPPARALREARGERILLLDGGALAGGADWPEAVRGEWDRAGLAAVWLDGRLGWGELAPHPDAEER